MLSLEEEQDARAAQIAKKETNADSAEFDENVTINETNNIENPSEQYLDLINMVIHKVFTVENIILFS
jgi:hypothetical protein